MVQGNGIAPIMRAQLPDRVVDGAAATRPGSPGGAKLRKAAGEFEAILLESLWKSMKETFRDPGDPGSDPTLEGYDDWAVQAMASQVGNAGGIGIKNMIVKYLEPSAVRWAAPDGL
jgi:Rod binding domain-containing protein